MIAQVITRLDPLPESVRVELASNLVTWLADQQLITPSLLPLAKRESYGLSDWQPGPRWSDVVKESDYDLQGRLNNGVDVISEKEIQSAHGNSTNPSCQRCDREFPLYERFELVEKIWLAGGEPLIACEGCGWVALLGDWPTKFRMGLVGAPTVIFNNWSQLRPSFVNELKQHMGGGRCRYFEMRI
ncbi:hypothetical protein C5E08_08840 [Rathayibacter iranicus]|nr:hypothetical protein C5E08_08840 [Rathayibacter iranicus]PPI71696.1 hypothetical protein C5E01_07875 [Rathayibacter iranicus]PWJ64896.1 hypothetical protein B0H03_104269 [Rathayibacter iranicus NCPPB 2253 = VKM Ac-1602]